MGDKPRSRLMNFWMSLRARVALSVALPFLLVLISLSLMHYRRERQLLEDQIRLTVVQLGEVMMGGLRHTMMSREPAMVAQAVSDVGKMSTVERVQVIYLDGRVVADSGNEAVGTVYRLEDPGCVDCHRVPAAARPRTTRFSAEDGLLRISTPILNEPDCAGCHAEEGAHLGVVIADLSVLDFEKRLGNHLRVDLAVSVAGTVLVIGGLYLLLHRLVVRRVEAFRRPLDAFSAGDFASRLPVPSGSLDELGELATTFNRMADELDRHAREQEELSKVRQRAIVEERERIARDLHDGLAQLLGYVNTKAMAVRLMLQKRQMEAADRHLRQLEEAAQELFVDVREAIFDLRSAERVGAGLSASLKDFAAQFSQLNGLPIELEFAVEDRELLLTPEVELQLLHIVQESLANVRKHASAARVWISLRLDGGDVLELTIKDDGEGFDPERIQATRRPRFGLSMMRERAEAIGAEFGLDSSPGTGTRVTIRLAARRPS